MDELIDERIIVGKKGDSSFNLLAIVTVFTKERVVKLLQNNKFKIRKQTMAEDAQRSKKIID